MGLFVHCLTLQYTDFFTPIIKGDPPNSSRAVKDPDGNIFIDRPGKYFQPILEYLITDEVVVPEGMSTKALCREAAFYHIHFPLVEDHESLSFVTGKSFRW